MSEVKKGTSGYSEYFRLVTSSGTPFGGALASLVSGANVASLFLSYTRNQASPISSLCSALSSEGAAHSGFKAFEIYSGFVISSNRAPGLFRVDIPDSAFVAGADKVILALTHPAADVAMVRHDLVDNIESDTFVAVGSLDTRVGSVGIMVGSLSTFLQVDSLHSRVNSIFALVGSSDVRLSSAAAQVGSIFAQTGSLQMAINSWHGDRGIFITSAAIAGGASVTVNDVTSNALALFFNRATAELGINAVSGSVVRETWRNAGAGSTDLTSLNAITNSIVTQVGSLYARVGERTTNAPLAFDTASIAVQVGSLYARVGEIVAGVPLASYVGSIATTLGSLHTRVGSADTRISSAATAVGSVQVGVDAIGLKTVNLPPDPADASDITASFLSTAVSISSLDTRVASLAVLTGSADTRISSISTQVGSLYARVGELAAATPLAAQVSSLSALVGNAAGSLDVHLGSLQTLTGSIFAQVGSVFTTLGSLHARVGSAATETGSIATGVGSLSFGVNVHRVNSDSNAASNLRRGVLGNVVGTVGNGATRGIVAISALDPAASVANQFVGRIVTFDRATATAALRGQATDILSNNAAGDLGVTSLTTAPANGDSFTIT